MHFYAHTQIVYSEIVFNVSKYYINVYTEEREGEKLYNGFFFVFFLKYVHTLSVVYNV